MNNKIRIAIVGTGYFSQFHFDAWKRLEVKVVAICSLNEKDAIYYSNEFNNCPVYSDFKKMINEIDLDFVDKNQCPDSEFLKNHTVSEAIITMATTLTNSFLAKWTYVFSSAVEIVGFIFFNTVSFFNPLIFL